MSALALFLAYCAISLAMSVLLGTCFYHMGDKS